MSQDPESLIVGIQSLMEPLNRSYMLALCMVLETVDDQLLLSQPVIGLLELHQQALFE